MIICHYHLTVEAVAVAAMVSAAAAAAALDPRFGSLELRPNEL